MIGLQQISMASVSGNRPLVVENPEKSTEPNQLNPTIDTLSFEELSELAEEYLEIDEEIKRAKEHKLRIWGEDKYLSKPLGSSILEREKLSKETLKSINILQSRKEHIEYVIYSNKNNILFNVNPEVLKSKIGKLNFQPHHTEHKQYKPTTSSQHNSDITSNDLITFPEFVTMKFQTAYRRVANQISNILDSKEAIIDEFKRLFLKGNAPKESRLLVQLLIEHKRNYSNITSPAA